MTRLASAVACGLALVAASWASVATAQPSPDMSVLADKTVRIIIGGPPNGGTDNYSRPFADGLKSLLPGTTVLVQNVAGGGGVLALIEAQASPNTINLVTIQNVVLYSQVTASETLPVDLLEFHAVGSFTHDQRVLAVRVALGASTFEDLAALGRPLVISAATEAAAARYEALILSALTDVRFRVLVGIDNATREMLFMSGDSDADLNGYNSLRSLIDSGVGMPILRMSVDGYPPELAGVQTLKDVAGSRAPAGLLGTMDSFNRLGRIVLAAPSTEPAVVEALRAAFDTIVASAELGEAYARQQLVLVPTAGADVDQRLQALLGEPAALETFRAFVACGERRAAGEAIACTGL
jgi:tripartite-type tricarboxylate transporter receptor subunit TctC